MPLSNDTTERLESISENGSETPEQKRRLVLGIEALDNDDFGAALLLLSHAGSDGPRLIKTLAEKSFSLGKTSTALTAFRRVGTEILPEVFIDQALASPFPFEAINTLERIGSVYGLYELERKFIERRQLENMQLCQVAIERLNEKLHKQDYQSPEDINWTQQTTNLNLELNLYIKQCNLEKLLTLGAHALQSGIAGVGIEAYEQAGEDAPEELLLVCSEVAMRHGLPRNALIALRYACQKYRADRPLIQPKLHECAKALLEDQLIHEAKEASKLSGDKLSPALYLEFVKARRAELAKSFVSLKKCEDTITAAVLFQHISKLYAEIKDAYWEASALQELLIFEEVFVKQFTKIKLKF